MEDHELPEVGETPDLDVSPDALMDRLANLDRSASAWFADCLYMMNHNEDEGFAPSVLVDLGHAIGIEEGDLLIKVERTSESELRERGELKADPKNAH